MGDPTSYAVDPDDIDQMVRDLSACERALESLITDLEQQIATLHETWEGLAAQAQKEAQAEWEKGLAAMRASLTSLREAAGAAHRNYTGAVNANLTMWRQVR